MDGLGGDTSADDVSVDSSCAAGSAPVRPPSVAPPSLSKHVKMRMASVVMKVVQGRAQRMAAPAQACAVKLGDDDTHSKAQVDPRLPADVAQPLLQRLITAAHDTAELAAHLMKHDREGQVARRLSAVLSEAYEEVVVGGVLQGAA